MNDAYAKHHRRSIRLKGYDYTQAGAYFVTFVTRDRAELFGKIANVEMVLNQSGQIALETWQHLPDHYAYVQLDEFCVMPNHVHGIILLIDEGGIGSDSPRPQTAAADGKGGFETRPDAGKRHPLSEIVRAFKTFSARRINEMCETCGQGIWQRNYYEHIIQNEVEYERIRKYIEANPMVWTEDQLHPDASPNPFNNPQRR